MMKKNLKKGALGLTLVLAIAALGDISPKASQAAATEMTVAEEAPTAGWQIDGEWDVAEDTTVTDEVREMIREPFFHVVGVGRMPIMYLGSQVTADGTNHCILCRNYPVIPNPPYTYVLYYVNEDASGRYNIYKTRVLKAAEYGEYAVIGRQVWFADFYKYNWSGDAFLYYSGKGVHRIGFRKDGSEETPEKSSFEEGLRILSVEDPTGYYIEDLDYSENPDANTPGMIINGTEYAFENGRIYLSRVPEADRYDITMVGAEKPVIESITLSKKKVTLKKGKKTTVKVSVPYEMEDSVTLVWKSSNKKIATVKNGVIKAKKKKGTCTITCRIKGSSVKATCKVKVK